MTYCNQHTLVKSVGDHVTAYPLRCRCWQCTYCAPWRRAQLVRWAKDGKPTTFITLTSNPHWGPNPQYRARRLIDAWRLIVRQLRRLKRYRNLQYLVVMESTARGEPHLHILARALYIDHKWLSNRMKELTSAPVVDIRRIRGPKEAAKYVSKYVGKEPHQYNHCKRYWYSQDWAHPTRAEMKRARDPNTKFFRAVQGFTEYQVMLRAVAHNIILSAPNMLDITLSPAVRAPPGASGPLSAASDLSVGPP